MSQFFQELITEYVHSRPNAKKLNPKHVAKRLQVRKRDYEEFLAAWKQLFQLGVATFERSGLEQVTEDVPGSTAGEGSTKLAPGLLKGVIKRIGVRGAVFLATADAAGQRAGAMPLEVSILPQDLYDAQVGDEVIVRLIGRRGGGNRRYGKVVEVLARATNTFVGTYDEFDGQGYVTIDGRNFTEPIAVGDPGAKGAVPGDKVVIEVLRFPSHARPGEAVLTRVLGAKGEPGVDLLSIIHEFGLPDEFSADVLREASRDAERFDEHDLRGRVDLTNDTIVTIDPIDARDFDDAISLKRNEAGHWVLGVHIADVAHFVRPGSALDREARRRGTSVYLPTRVIPMLPEVISNGLASLQQGRVRYTNSVFLEFTPDGVLVDTQFVKSAIRVTRRFAYEEVLPLIREGAKSTGQVTPLVRQLLRDMHELAMTLRRRRLAAGSLDLNLPEVKLDFDRDGKVCGAHEVVHDESHQIIEEFMLAANIAVATKLNDLGVGFLRRVHAEPDSLKLQNFARFVATLGFEVGEARPRFPHRTSKRHNRKSSPTPFDQPQVLSKAALQELLQKVRGKPEEHAINYALLRSLRQAEYSGLPIGHYALAVQEYCHFTSPIRRYPDLTVHRLFDELAAGKTPRGPSDVELEILGAHCSDTERRAAQAERELTRIKLLAFMAERIGEEFDARITGVERFGLFCRGIAIPVEGFIHVSTLAEIDYFDYDAASICFVGRQTGRVLRLGDQVRVQVAFVHVDRRELDFRLAGTRSTERPKRRETRRERRAPPQSSRPRGNDHNSDSRKSRRRGR